MNRKLNHALASLVLMYSATAWSQEIHTTIATIESKDGYTTIAFDANRKAFVQSVTDKKVD